MKEKYGKRNSRKIILITIVLPILWCLLISIALLFRSQKHVEPVESAVAAEISILENAYSSQDFVLSLIGLAISVWIGLNIYNVLSKEELKELLDKAEHATEITERIYTEVLISKFRLSPADRTVSYLAARLEIVDLLPEEILEDLITIEDLFSFSYSLYENGISSPYNKEGMELSIKFMEHAAKYRKDRKINYEQYSLIMGQLSLRLADFSYFSAQYGDCDVSQRKIYAQNAIEKYKESVFYLFNIRDITLCDRPDLYQPEERQSIAFLANNIGSAYILFMSPLSDSEKETVIEVEKVAIKFSNEVSSKAVAVFRRNLGASYERANKMNLAYTEYCESFRLDQKNWKTSHCLGSWYRKQVYVRFPAIPKNLILSDSHISSLQEGERDEMVQMLKHAAYWYELKKVNNSGKPESWLITIYRCIYQMTNDEKYKEKIDWLEDEKRYYDIVFA